MALLREPLGLQFVCPFLLFWCVSGVPSLLLCSFWVVLVSFSSFWGLCFFRIIFVLYCISVLCETCSGRRLNLKVEVKSVRTKWKMLIFGVPRIWDFPNSECFLEPAGIIFRHFDAQQRKANIPLRSGPARRVGPSLCALLLLAALLAYVFQHARFRTTHAGRHHKHSYDTSGN